MPADLPFLLFTLFNALRVVSYVPQMVRVARDTHGAVTISLTTWTLWIGANASTAAYAWCNVGDPWLALVSSGNTTCSACVVALTLWKRAALRREDAAHAAIPARVAA